VTYPASHIPGIPVYEVYRVVPGGRTAGAWR